MRKVRKVLRDHPMIQQIERTGYPRSYLPVDEEPKQTMPEVDYYGSKIIEGEKYIVVDGDIVLMENLERFLSEEWHLEFKVAE